jgi:peptidoglycan/LPS O-acetylase OafA/YrhL
VATTSVSSSGLNPSPTTTKKLSFRPDIQGLRAIAVISVVLYHAGVPALQGGYVGVDIFFVISGFLIIGLLWREIETTGRIHLRSFYARRIRRLLPATTVVALSILVATRLFMPPLTFTNIAREGLATSVFMVNVLFARNETQYSGNPSPSPFQHYWSLNVEEQFYVLLPLFLMHAGGRFDEIAERDLSQHLLRFRLRRLQRAFYSCLLTTHGRFSRSRRVRGKWHWAECSR